MKPTYYATDHVIHTDCDRCNQEAACVVVEDNDTCEWHFCRECSDRLIFLGKLEAAE